MHADAIEQAVVGLFTRSLQVPKKVGQHAQHVQAVGTSSTRAFRRFAGSRRWVLPSGRSTTFRKCHSGQHGSFITIYGRPRRSSSAVTIPSQMAPRPSYRRDGSTFNAASAADAWRAGTCFRSNSKRRAVSSGRVTGIAAQQLTGDPVQHAPGPSQPSLRPG